tara:strand:+ start:446 stop:922 length:477 start_codon:yes stop_codon:yes gene_type:complete
MYKEMKQQQFKMKYIIYQFCKDDKVYYIGCTKNFAHRKYCHRYDCAGNKKKLALYDFMNENDGFDSFTMEAIVEIDVDSYKSATVVEQNYINKLKPILNVNRAYVSKEVKKEEEKLRGKKRCVRIPCSYCGLLRSQLHMKQHQSTLLCRRSRPCEYPI